MVELIAVDYDDNCVDHLGRRCEEVSLVVKHMQQPCFVDRVEVVMVLYKIIEEKNVMYDFYESKNPNPTGPNDQSFQVPVLMILIIEFLKI